MSLWVSILSYGVALLGVAIVGIYMYMGRKHKYWKSKGVKHLNPLPIVGNMKDIAFMRKSMGDVFKQVYDQYKREPFMGLYSFDSPILLINDLNLLRDVLIKDFQYFCDRNFEVNEKVDLLASKALFSLKGDRWKQTRNAITPSFTSGKMKRMYEIVHENAGTLADTLERENTGKPIKVFELCARYTTDVIVSCAFGINSGTLRDSNAEFRQKLKIFFEFTPIQALKAFLTFIAPKLLEVTNFKVLSAESEEYIAEIVKTTMNHRKEHGIKRYDLLESLVEIMNEGEVSETERSENAVRSRIKMDIKDVEAHSLSFLAAGFESSATTMTYTMYELAKHPTIQDRLREEIQTVLGGNNGQIPYDNLHSMKYLDMVVSETLRKYPPVPFLDRRSNAPYKLPGTDLTLEAGSVVIVPVLGIHRDSEIYPDPMAFIPERFSEENKRTRPSCTHMPFGEGPRTCVGLRFALLQAKLGLIHILKDHSVHHPTSTPMEVEFSVKSFLLQPKEPVHLVFRKL